jgi:dihydroorotase
MKILIKGGRVIDPSRNFDDRCDLAVAAGRIVSIGAAPEGFAASRVIDATGCIVAPGLVDLAVRLREPGHEHEGMLESEMAAAVAGGVTSVVCPPDTDPVLDEPGLVEMLKMRAEKLHQARVFPLGALTRGLAGEVLTEMAELTEAGCVGFSQAEVPLANTQVLQRAFQYAATFGHTVWLRPQELHLGKGVAASGPLATRLGLSGVPVAAETIALHTLFELMKMTGARVHLCRISSAAGIDLIRQAKAQGLPVTCDVSINSLHLTDADIGFFDSRMRLNPPLRQQRDRDALRAALADGAAGTRAGGPDRRSGGGAWRIPGYLAGQLRQARGGRGRRHLRLRSCGGLDRRPRQPAKPGQAHPLWRLRVAWPCALYAGGRPRGPRGSRGPRDKGAPRVSRGRVGPGRA